VTEGFQQDRDGILLANRGIQFDQPIAIDQLTRAAVSDSGQVVHGPGQRLGQVGHVRDNRRVVTDQWDPQRRYGGSDLGIKVVAVVVELGFYSIQSTEKGYALVGQFAGHLTDNRSAGSEQANQAVAKELFPGFGQTPVDLLEEMPKVIRY